MPEQTTEAPPVTLTMIVETGRFKAAVRGASTALAGVLPGYRAVLAAAAEAEYDRSVAQVLATPREVVDHWERELRRWRRRPRPYAHRARWAGRRPRR
jgi:hypothetical protein